MLHSCTISTGSLSSDVILFCGVHFMAETASILSPDKTVLLPRKDAGCPMSDMITPESLKARLKELPRIPVVTYVNSAASVKALSDICCTSANAVKVAESLNENEILMIPDRNLALYTASRTDKKIHLWEGYCPIHDRLTPEEVMTAKRIYPEAVFMAHPECRPEILDLADVILSTSGMIRYAGESDSKSFIVGTETGILYPLKKAYPDKIFYPVSEKMKCEDMKKISLEDVARSLEYMDGEVKVPEDIRKNALKAVQRMTEIRN